MTVDKTHLSQWLNEKLDEKIASLQHLISETRTSNNDTKSSMGDKYETGREMLQQEINHLQLQLSELVQQKEQLKIMPAGICRTVQNGALVKTNQGIFYLSVPLGTLFWDDEKITTVSVNAPLAKAMLGLRVGDLFSVGKNTFVIEKIW